MVKYFFLIFSIWFFLGCSNSDTTTLQDTQSTSKYLTISKAPINSEPVSITQKFALKFSTQLNQNTINTSSVYLLHNIIDNTSSQTLAADLNETVQTLLEVTSDTINLSPLQFLHPNGTYTLVVTTDVKDTAGNSLSQDYHFRFTTLDEAYDQSPLGLRALTPQQNATDALVQTDIVLDFNKTITIAPELLSDVLEVKDSNGNVIGGSVTLFNSLLRFSPSSTLPYDTNITLSLVGNVSDMYANSYSGENVWSFKTRTQAASPVINEGFVPLDTANINKTSLIVKNIYNTASASKIAVATTNSIEIYRINYPELYAKPSFEYLHSYPISNILSMIRTDESHIVVSTADNGLYSLELNENNISQRAHIDASEAIYALNVGFDSNNTLQQIYAVGPQYGFNIFDYNLSSGSLNLQHSLSANDTLYLDVLELKSYDPTNGLQSSKVYVADYKGGVDIYDENFTKVGRADINGSVKKLAIHEDYNGAMGLFAICSSGKVQGFGFDGVVSPYVQLDLLNTPVDVTSFVDTQNFFSQLYYASLNKGLLIANGDYASDIIQTDGTVVSSDVVSGFFPSKSFLITLDQDGTLKLYNAIKDTQNPTLVTTPSDGGSIQTFDANFTIELSDTYPDLSSINKANFSFQNINNTDIDFNISISNGAFTSVIELTPLTSLSPGKYTVTIDANISDMLGHKLNNTDSNTSVGFIVTNY